MKNICFIEYDMSETGGVEKVTSQLANSLCDKYNVFFISILKCKDKVQFKLNEKIKTLIICKEEKRIRQLSMICFNPIKNFLKKNNIDIVFVEGNYPVPIVLPVKFFSASKFIFCDHGALMNQYDNRKILFFRKLASKFFDGIITLTERNMNDYIEKLNVKPSKITYIYNWFDEKILDYKKSYNCESKEIITVGRFTKEKGYDMLIDVAKIVFDRHPDWSWNIFGDGEEFEDIKGKIQKNNLQENVILKGLSANVYSEYSRCSIYVLPSYREGMPLVLLEAKASGLPIVSFDCVTGPAEIVRDNVDGFLIKPYDKKDMADKICTLIENVERRKLFSENTGQNLNKFSKSDIMKKWINVIESCK